MVRKLKAVRPRPRGYPHPQGVMRRCRQRCNKLQFGVQKTAEELQFAVADGGTAESRRSLLSRLI
ncbi:MAG: hypothetical protein ACO2PN_16085 [Pyrobaculum sp.]|jgi:hypothetical protein